MTRSNWLGALAVGACTLAAGCGLAGGGQRQRFDALRKEVAVGNWNYGLLVENQNEKAGVVPDEPGKYYLKATLSLANTKTQKSLLYSASTGVEDYEAKYKYLSFKSGADLCIRHKGVVINPVGYVFEPSNGLSPSERLVYKFILSSEQYDALKESRDQVEYWYTDHLIGLGKICFNINN